MSYIVANKFLFTVKKKTLFAEYLAFSNLGISISQRHFLKNKKKIKFSIPFRIETILNLNGSFYISLLTLSKDNYLSFYMQNL